LKFSLLHFDPKCKRHTLAFQPGGADASSPQVARHRHQACTAAMIDGADGRSSKLDATTTRSPGFLNVANLHDSDV
jgi:hypothetical protein